MRRALSANLIRHVLRESRRSKETISRETEALVKGVDRLMKSRYERLSKPELDFLIDNCNFSKDEAVILHMASTGESEIQIADKMNISPSSVAKRKARILTKIFNFLEVSGEMTTIYVNGKRVAKDELKNHEIKIDNVKRILSEKLTKR